MKGANVFMKFQYVCKDVSVTDAMKKSSEEKLAKFNRYFKAEEINCLITVLIRPNKQKSVEVALSTLDGVYIRAKAVDEDFYNAIDTCVEKLDGQIRKMKTQIDKAKNKQNSLSKNFDLEQIQSDKLEDEDLVILRRKSLSLTPMDEEEALARMDALGHSFFIYLDSATGLVNVLYERDDHGFGVIEVEK